jgi:probable DNA metabolism protein
VLPLIRRHFESRFADQNWIIYDTVRNYGLCPDRIETRELKLGEEEFKVFAGEETNAETLCQRLWKRYFEAINIAQRINPRLHISRLPRRYWKCLPEKRA